MREGKGKIIQANGEVVFEGMFRNDEPVDTPNENTN